MQAFIDHPLMIIIIPAVLLLSIILIAQALSGIKIAQEYERGVVFRLGRYRETRGPGLYYNIPIIEWQRLVDIRTVTETVEQQETITKDSVTIKVNAVLWYRILDPAKSIISVENHRNAVYQVALTSLRNIIGQHVLDDVLRERNRINQKLRDIVEEMASPWGIEVLLVEMKDVEIPAAMQRAMAREAEAIREKRARLIKAEAELESSEKLTAASQIIDRNPAALELRRFQMISEVGAEHNSTVIMLIPSVFTDLAKNLSSSSLGQSPPRAA